MTLRWILASLHLLALGIGLGAVCVRAMALRRPDANGLRRAFAADTAWGLAAGLWIATGAARAFGGLEKGSDYYLGSTAFQVKMALLLAILVLEVAPMVTLVRWRIQLKRGAEIDLRRAPLLARISLVQAVLVVCMVFAATAMARGMGA